MTRKDYAHIANAIKYSKTLKEFMTIFIATEMAQNSRFNPVIFAEHCKKTYSKQVLKAIARG